MQVKAIGSFLPRTTDRAIATKFEEEIIRLKDLCTHIDIIVENLSLKTTASAGGGAGWVAAAGCGCGLGGPHFEAFNSSGTKKEGAEPDSVGKVPRSRWGWGWGRKGVTKNGCSDGPQPCSQANN